MQVEFSQRSDKLEKELNASFKLHCLELHGLHPVHYCATYSGTSLLAALIRQVPSLVEKQSKDNFTPF